MVQREMDHADLYRSLIRVVNVEEPPGWWESWRAKQGHLAKALETQVKLTKRDQIIAMLDAAAVDDEPVTADDRRHIEEGWQAHRDGQVFTAEEIKRVCLDAKGDKGRVEAKRRAAV